MPPYQWINFFLVIFSRTMPIVTNWGNWILNHPQSKKEHEPQLRWDLSLPMIPNQLLRSVKKFIKKVAQYVYQKFRKALDDYAIKITADAEMQTKCEE